MTKVDIQKLAKLANLQITEEEAKDLEQDLSKTLETIAVLNEVNTKGVTPMHNLTGLTNITREDKATNSLNTYYSGLIITKRIL